ncbi:hypothetical protein F2Q70_00039091 [Brassica cretica]|uniref:CCHC-type domain-containing protein n=1 Tax=Brassica cretica TaxID=69181 RepID=A0A8S9KAA3_BRACR|nr:hypothetical protein F2Q70_00039091 [Brassica cretica]
MKSAISTKKSLVAVSSGLETSVPWSKLMVKDVRQLRLNQDTMETSCLELDDSLSWGQLAISSPKLGGVFWSGPVWPGLSGYRTVPMVRVGRVQVRSWLNQAMRKRPGGVGFRVGTARGAVGAVMGAVLSGFGRKDPWGRFWASFFLGKALKKSMDTRQKEKEKEKQKDLAPGERTPKSVGSDLMALIQGLGRFRNVALGLSRAVQTWTVVRERNCEDSSRGKMCGDWGKSKKGKEAAGASGNVEAERVDPTQVLPTQVLPTQTGLINNETGLPQGPILLTESNREEAGDQRDQNQDQEAETSRTDERVGLNMAGGAENVETGPEREVAEPSMREVLEALKFMGAHMVTLTQVFTPLVNSSVGQVTPPVRVAPRAAGPTARSAPSILCLNWWRGWQSLRLTLLRKSRPECPKCGRRHGGECWRAMGACTRCGKMDHAVRDCPGPDQSRGLGSGGGGSFHYHGCGKAGHLRRDCPKSQGGQDKNRGEANKSSQNRGQSSTPRVYELSKDADEAGPFKAITGKTS